MEKCVFCKILDGQILAHKIYETDDVFVFLDIDPYTKGHSLIIPKKHYQDIFDIPDEELKELIIEVKKVAKLHKERLGAKDINVFQRNGILAGQEIEHIHFHVVSRDIDDEVEILPRGQYKGNDFEEVVELLTKQI
jgi:histidine triad (HIT) family protein